MYFFIKCVSFSAMAFRFNEPDHSKNEGSDLILIASIAKTAGTTLANPIIFNIFPVTIPEARSRGVIIPRQADLVSDSRSPYEAGKCCCLKTSHVLCKHSNGEHAA